MPIASSVRLRNPQDPTLELFLESCRHGNLSSIQAQINTRDPQDGSLTRGLNEAAKFNQVEAMGYLMDHGAIIDETTITSARSPAAFKLLMANGFHPNKSLSWGEVPLRSVVAKNNEELLEWFLAQGADPNLGPSDTNTEVGFVSPNHPPVTNSGGPLEAAAFGCSTQIVDLLLSHGAKIENSLVLHSVVWSEREDWKEMMEHLVLQCRADVNKFGRFPSLHNGGTAFLLAAKTCEVEKARWLLEHGADPLIPDSSDIYPLMWALDVDEGTDRYAPFFRQAHQRAQEGRHQASNR